MSLRSVPFAYGRSGGSSSRSSKFDIMGDSEMNGATGFHLSGGLNGHGDSQNNTETCGTNLIINYLPQGMTDQEFHKLFSSVVNPETCKLIKDRQTRECLGYGFVNYATHEDAVKTIKQLNGLRLQNKIIKVSFARPSNDCIKGANLYVSGLPRTMTQLELEELFSICGPIITSRILTDRETGLSKGVGFVRFDKQEQAKDAIDKLNGLMPKGSTEPITVKFASSPMTAGKKLPNSNQFAQLMPPRRSIFNELQAIGFPSLSGVGAYAGGNGSPLPAGNSPGFCLFVHNLSPDADESTLYQLFGPYGAINSVKVIRDYQTNKCKGYGFVTMKKYDEAAIAIRYLDSSRFANRTLQVSFKRNTAQM